MIAIFDFLRMKKQHYANQVSHNEAQAEHILEYVNFGIEMVWLFPPFSATIAFKYIYLHAAALQLIGGARMRTKSANRLVDGVRCSSIWMERESDTYEWRPRNRIIYCENDVYI